MSSLTILQRGAPVLSAIAEPVRNMAADEIKQLIVDLKTTVAQAKGVGIAAPQIGKSLRLFLMCSAPSERYPDAPLLPVTVIINPVILNFSAEQVLGWEGCLSVKGKRALVARYTSIDVSYFDDKGIKHNQTFTGFLARIFQHELDHLDGITFLERLDNESDAIDEQLWREQNLQH